VAQLPTGWYVRVLEAENAALRQREQEMQRLISQLQQDSEQQQRLNSQLQQDSEQKQRLISQLQQDSEQAQRLISQLQQEIQQQQRLISQLHEDYAQLLQNAMAVTVVLLQQNKQQEECICAHTACSQALGVQLVNSSASYAATANKLNWVTQELDIYKAECASLSAQYCSIKEQLKADNTAMKDQLQLADSDNTRLAEQLSLLQEQTQSPPATPCATTPYVAASADSSPAHTITSSAAQQVSNMVSAAAPVHKQSSQQPSPIAAQLTHKPPLPRRPVPKATGLPLWRP